MNSESVDRIVNSVLYEGYLLYPYRRAIKNVKRWTFGGVYPDASSEARSGTERSWVRARCLVVGPANASIAAEVRFLHLIERRAGGDGCAPWECWQETTERRIALPSTSIGQLAAGPHREHFEFPAKLWQTREVCGATNEAVDVLRRQEAISGTIETSACCVVSNVVLLTVSLVNDSPCEDNRAHAADSSQLLALASAHVIFHADGGQFVSRIDPPEEYRELCSADPADALWPILVGESHARDTMLCSPIILYDYPEVAPESPGDFFDATEIDEMLALRILTLTDEEKRAMVALDQRGRALLERTEGLAEKELARLHGATRSLRTIEESAHGH